MKKIISIAFAAVLLALGIFAGSANAGTSSLSGWAWSSNTGWASFSGTNSGAGGGSYSVTISTTTPTGGTGALSGYVWAGGVDAQSIKSGLGWISFNAADVTGCPNTTGALNGCNPTIDMTTGKVTGWARVLSVKNPLTVTSGSTGGNVTKGYVAAVSNGYVYASTDGGVTWTQKTASGTGWWTSVAASGDGQSIYAYNQTAQTMYRSTDGGTTWAAVPGLPGGYYTKMQVSVDGQKLATAKYFDSVYVSTDGGATWAARQSFGGQYGIVAASTDGKYLVAAGNVGPLYTSSDWGTTWTLRSGAGSRNWGTATISDDGQRVAVVATYPSFAVYVSSDGGATWSAGQSLAAVGENRSISFMDKLKEWLGVPSASAATATVHWSLLTGSADGMRLAAAQSGGALYTSADGGATWTARTALGTLWWTSLTSSPDGQEIAIGEYLGPIRISTDGGATWSSSTSGSLYWNGLDFYTSSTGGSTSSYDNRGGYEGWISLSGTNHASPDTSGNGGVTYYPTTVGSHPAGSFAGYAWGGEVVGWLNFTPASGGGGVTCPGCTNVQPVPTAAISAAPATVTSGSAPTITWSSTNATACTGTNFSTGTATSGTAPGQTQTVQTTYTVTCTGPGGSANASVIVPVNVTTGNLKLLIGDTDANLPTGYYSSGYSSYRAKATEPFALRWNVGIPTTGGASAYICSATPPASGTWSDWNGTNGGAILTSNSLNTTIPSGMPSGAYIFTIACANGIGDTQSSSVVLNVQSSTLEEF